MKRVLVTGGAGFIGSALCRHLVQVEKRQVLNLDKLTYAGGLSALKDIEHSGLYRFEKTDICDRKTVAEQIEAFKPDWILHLAAESHVDRSIAAPAAFIESNIRGTYELLECARAYWDGLPPDRKATFRFLQVSTDEVYGSLGAAGRFSETTAYDPHSPYAASKASADHLVRAWHHTYGLPVLITNSSNNYGPFQFPEKLIPVTIISALHEQKIPIYGNGKNIRDWIHVDDHVRALTAAAEQGRVGQTYNIGSRNEHTNLDVVEMICGILDELRPRAALNKPSYKELITFVADRPGHDERYAVDPSRLETELGWNAQVEFAAGLRSTVQWVLDNEAWWNS